MAVLRRNNDLAGSLSEQEVSNALLSKYKAHNASNSTLSILARSCIKIHTHSTPRSDRPEDKVSDLWMKLPSDPLLVQSVPKILAGFPRSNVGDFGVRACWANGQPNLSNRVGSSNASKFNAIGW